MSDATPDTPQDPSQGPSPGATGSAPQPTPDTPQDPSRHATADTTGSAPQPTPEKDPADWTTGGEPATGPQLSYLSTLAQEAGEEVPENLTKADASKLIDQLQSRTGRGGQPTGA